MKNENVVFMRVHQAVSFEKGLASYFNESGSAGKSAAKMTIIADSQCVLVEGPNDRVLVPFVNVAFLTLESKSTLEKKAQLAATKSKAPVKAQDIKRPR